MLDLLLFAFFFSLYLTPDSKVWFMSTLAKEIFRFSRRGEFTVASLNGIRARVVNCQLGVLTLSFCPVHGVKEKYEDTELNDLYGLLGLFLWLCKYLPRRSPDKTKIQIWVSEKHVFSAHVSLAVSLLEKEKLPSQSHSFSCSFGRWENWTTSNKPSVEGTIPKVSSCILGLEGMLFALRRHCMDWVFLTHRTQR